MRERQRVCDRAGRHEEYGDLFLEDFREELLDSFGPIVTAVPERVTGVGAGNRLKNLRSYAGSVVAGEVHDPS